MSQVQITRVLQHEMYLFLSLEKYETAPGVAKGDYFLEDAYPSSKTRGHHVHLK